MLRLALASLATIVVISAGWLACSSSSSSTAAGPNDAAVEASSKSDGPAPGLFTLGVPCTDSIASIYGDPGTLPSDHGHVIKCAVEPDLAKSDMQAAATQGISTDDAPPATNIGYVGKPFTSGAHVYRILYRTERGDPNNSPGYSSARVFIPDTPRAAGPLPLLVASHATSGQAGHCAPSETSKTMSAPWELDDIETYLYPIVGLGLPAGHAGPRWLRERRRHGEPAERIRAVPRRRQEHARRRPGAGQDVPRCVQWKGCPDRALAGRTQRALGARDPTDVRAGRRHRGRRHAVATLAIAAILGRHPGCPVGLSARDVAHGERGIHIMSTTTRTASCSTGPGTGSTRSSRPSRRSSRAS